MPVINIDPNITDGSFGFYSCRGKDQQCSDLEKTQYMQQIYLILNILFVIYKDLSKMISPKNYNLS